MSSKMLKCILKKGSVRIRALFVAVMHGYVQLQVVVHRSTKNNQRRKKVSLMTQNISCNIKLRAGLEQDRRCCGLF